MKVELLEEIEITDFEREIGVELVIKERLFNGSSNKWYARFQNSDTKDGNILIRSYGVGNTVDDCLKDYCKEISFKRLILNALSENRKEILLPKLVHTKKINIKKFQYGT